MRNVLKLMKNNFPVFAIFIFRVVAKKFRIFLKKLPNFFVPEDPQLSETFLTLILTVVRFLVF